MKRLLWLCVGVYWLTACAAQPRIGTVAQGICGTLLEKRGNQMPSPERKAATGRPVSYEVRVYPLLTTGQVQLNPNGIISSVGDVQPIQTTKADSLGAFCLGLEPGRYTLLVQLPNGRLYANLFDAENHIFPVTVQPHKRTDVEVIITNRAVF